MTPNCTYPELFIPIKWSQYTPIPDRLCKVDWRASLRMNLSGTFIAHTETKQVFRTEAIAKSSLEERFFSLANKWRNETGHFSVIARRYENPSYKAILNMRESAIPLILKELKRNPDRWFAALEKLTGVNPAKDAVNFYEAVDSWIAWGISNEYIV